MPAELGIKKNEIWAMRQGEKKPLVPVRVLDPGRFYEDTITVSLVSDPSEVRYVRRAKLPCKWAYLDEWLAPRKAAEEARRAEEAAKLEWLRERAEAELGAISGRELWILAELNQKQVRPLAYDVKNAAKAVDYNENVIYEAINSGALVARYANSKAVIPHDELDRWLRSLPTSRPPILDREFSVRTKSAKGPRTDRPPLHPPASGSQ